MKIKNIASVDVLIVGGTTTGIELAIKIKNEGKSVFIATPYTYFGEDICAELNYKNPPKAFRDLLFPGKELPTPMSIKRKLDRLVIANEIDFIFGLTPVKLMDGGLAVGGRDGIFFIAAGCIVDATLRQTVARMSKMPVKKFKPGNKLCTRRMLIAASSREIISDYEIENVPCNIVEKKLKIHMTDASLKSIYKAEMECRLATYDSTLNYTADRCRIELGDDLCGMDPDGYVFLPTQYRSLPRKIVAGDREYGELPLIGSFDVAVIGGGPAGAAAGIAAGRQGCSVLVAESLSHLGGMGTVGRIGCYWYGLRIGFTRELDRQCDAIQLPRKNLQSWDIECKQHCWELNNNEVSASVWLDTVCCGADIRDGRIVSVTLAGPHGSGNVTAKQFIDATGNSVIAHFCGAKTEFSSQNEPACQGSAVSPLRPGKNCDNTDFTFIVDSDLRDVTRAFVCGRDRQQNVFDLVQLPGTRERRRIVGELTLQPSDFFAGRTYADTLCLAFSNFDTHGFTVHPLMLFHPAGHDPQTVEIPMRALLSPEIHNLLTTGLGVSAHRDAMPLIRMQADVQNQGFAAATVAAFAALDNVDLRHVKLDKIQTILKNLGFFDAPASDFQHCVNKDALIFDNPDFAALKIDYQNAPEFEKALRLTLLGQPVGLELICRYVAEHDWDNGWDYKGMGQFGMSASRLDVAIMAVSNYTSDWTFFQDRLNELTVDACFSHIRSCCLFLRRHPSMEAAPKLFSLLSQYKCHAIGSYRDELDSPFEEGTNVSERNLQLKELYLAGALRACDPQNSLSISVLSKYKHGLHRLYAVYAEKWMQ